MFNEKRLYCIVHPWIIEAFFLMGMVDSDSNQFGMKVGAIRCLRNVESTYLVSTNPIPSVDGVGTAFLKNSVDIEVLPFTFATCLLPLGMTSYCTSTHIGNVKRNVDTKNTLLCFELAPSSNHKLNSFFYYYSLY